ncbi:Viral alkaline exonuclease [Popillia japonica]|uniref:Viral alkaline exonuclease n=1 Tax=Popillia japonica TaxID=7064 RepID=A0AAW1N0Z5_POPJA
MNNNDAEHYNAIVCKFVGGKRVHFSRRGSYENRCKAAAISFNQKEQYHNIIHKALTKNLPQSFTKRYIERKTRARLLQKKERKCIQRRRNKVYRRKKGNHNGPDADYGQVTSISDAPDVSEEILETEKKAFLRSLEKTAEDIEMIEAQTRGQNANPQWIEERAFRLTASNFGSICKMRSTTSRAKRVEQLLYPNFFGNTATKYGVENEGVAIKDFVRQHCYKIWRRK